MQSGGAKIRLLKHPYPFRAMLSISSDCDGMSLETFEGLHAYLNTRNETPLGEGLGLDISDSMWVYAPALAGTPLRQRLLSLKAGIAIDAPEEMGEILAHYVEAGWIDTLHSVGNFNGGSRLGHVPTIAHLDQAVKSFQRHGISIPIWVNHGNANNVQNIGLKPYMKGGEPGHELFAWPHIAEMGVRYVNVHEYAHEHSVRGLVPFQFGSRKVLSFSRFYTLNAEESDALEGVIKSVRTKNGRVVNYVWHPQSLHHQLSPGILKAVVNSGGHCIFAQHLGYKTKLSHYPESALEALRTLKGFQDRSDILVVRASRLLHFMNNMRSLRHTVEYRNDDIVINIYKLKDEISGATIPTAYDLRGINFSVSGWTGDIKLVIGNRLCPRHLLLRTVGLSGEQIIGVKWYDHDCREHHKRVDGGVRRKRADRVLKGVGLAGRRLIIPAAAGRTADLIKSKGIGYTARKIADKLRKV